MHKRMSCYGVSHTVTASFFYSSSLWQIREKPQSLWSVWILLFSLVVHSMYTQTSHYAHGYHGTQTAPTAHPQLQVRLCLALFASLACSLSVPSVASINGGPLDKFVKSVYDAPAAVGAVIRARWRQVNLCWSALNPPDMVKQDKQTNKQSLAGSLSWDAMQYCSSKNPHVFRIQQLCTGAEPQRSIFWTDFHLKVKDAFLHGLQQECCREESLCLMKRICNS